uniref:Syndecan n=1 Tax=Clastoptera arizonana TaxID=38151 RepID=A0A1B6EG38_9HEMI
MYLRLNILSFGVLILLGIRHTIAEEKKTQSNSLVPSTTKDDIYIDDGYSEGGSGNGGVSDDLESSGSGFGPDDEDGDGGSGIVITKTPPQKTSTQPPIVEPEIPNVVVNEVDRVNTINTGNPPFDPVFDEDESNRVESGVYMNSKHDERTTSFFAQPGILAAVIGGAVVGLLCAILVVMFIVYRMRKKDEGSYALEEPKRSPTSNSYSKNSNREFYA